MVKFQGLENWGLAVGHLVIQNIENKKNRNGFLEKEVKNLEKEVKENPEKFLNSDVLESYKKLDRPTTELSAVEAAPAILANLILKNGNLPTI